MPMTIHKMYASNLNVDAACSIDVPEDGTIVGVESTMVGITGSGTGGGARQQLSFGSTSAFSTNDARQVIVEDCCVANGLASNAMPAKSTKYTPMNLKVSAGERLYIHTATLGTAFSSGAAGCLIYIEGKSSTPRYRS